MKSETILVAKENFVTTIKLNRPEVLNALNMKMAEELNEVLDVVNKDDKSRVVILTGSGRGFCTGGDVKELFNLLIPVSVIENRDIHRNFQKIIHKIVNLEKPLIAAVNGFAVGSGCDLAMACDIRIASENAKFGEVFVKRGIIPDMGATYHLPLLVGMGKAKELIFTGDIIDASEAERIGLVNKVVPHDELETAVKDVANKIAANSPKALRMVKRLLNLDLDLSAQLEYAAFANAMLFQTDELKESTKAFTEKS